jgi:hypothetical protein
MLKIFVCFENDCLLRSRLFRVLLCNFLASQPIFSKTSIDVMPLVNKPDAVLSCARCVWQTHVPMLRDRRSAMWLGILKCWVVTGVWKYTDFVKVW